MDKIKSFEELTTLREKYKSKITNRVPENADKNAKKAYLYAEEQDVMLQKV